MSKNQAGSFGATTTPKLPYLELIIVRREPKNSLPFASRITKLPARCGTWQWKTIKTVKRSLEPPQLEGPLSYEWSPKTITETTLSGG